MVLEAGNIAGCSDQMKCDGQGRSKRNGAWREECMVTLNNLTIPDKIHPPCPQETPLESPIIDKSTLLDIPLTYDSNLEALMKMEGPAKRRKSGSGRKIGKLEAFEKDKNHVSWCLDLWGRLQ
ncbi:hypothetical protein F8388_023967 [Cannabis sativa]|uniref:Uncharacterized protein n=1 Tax=Cannabis sativa TaxID=3483 RepID=A0A7J6HW64_CANSA|nr:hypothetical protein F8388_023967 [Cannabis sativa]KAF4399225.1 hypothetical protein G4B88_022308 [Cannabis sativa]